MFTPLGLSTIRIPTPGLASTLILSNPPYTVTFWDEDLFPEDDYLSAMTFTPAEPGTIDINADPSCSSLTILLQTAVSTTDTSQVVVNGPPAVGIEWNAAGDTLLKHLVRASSPTIGSGATTSGRWVGFSIRSEENGWYHVLAASATGCTGTSDSLLYCSPDASFAIGLGLGELPEVVGASFEFDVSDWELCGPSTANHPTLDRCNKLANRCQRLVQRRSVGSVQLPMGE